MHIENEVKLDFKDVLIRPKRSTLSSRSNVDLIRPFTLRNSRVEYSGVPIIAANMDTTGTFEMAEALGKYDLSVALHKHYSEDEYVAYFNGLKRKSTAFYSMGVISPEERKRVAYHEAGHAIVGLVLSDSRTVRKVTIVPRGRAGGYNIMLPKEDENIITKDRKSVV